MASKLKTMGGTFTDTGGANNSPACCIVISILSAALQVQLRCYFIDAG